MEEIPLEVQTRNVLKKQKVKSLRRENLIPGVLYGGKRKPVTIQVDRKLFERIRRQHHGEIVFSLSVHDGGKSPARYHAMVREEQHHPVTDKILHVDFIRISLTEKIEAHVPIEAKGEAVGVKRDGGSLEHLLWEMTVSCLPTNIPQKIQVDISGLEINQVIHIKDIQLPEGVVAQHEPDVIVLSVVPPHREEITPAAEAEEGPGEPEVIKEKKPAEEAAGTEEEKSEKQAE